jgi:hypothetical protein
VKIKSNKIMNGINMFFSKMKWSVIAGFALVMFIQQSLFGSTDKNLVPALTYNNKCSFCHQAKSVQSLPDLKLGSNFCIQQAVLKSPFN